jgi:hypothetical protein
MATKCKNIFFVIPFLTLLSSCGGGVGSSDATMSSTTIAADPISAFSRLRGSEKAIVSSEIVVTSNGTFAAIITDVPGSKNPDYMGPAFPELETERLFTLHKWKDNAWVNANYPGMMVNPGDGACNITTRDFTGDGVKDFYVELCGFENGRGQVMVSDPSLWYWADFKYPWGAIVGDELQTGADGLYIDESTGELRGEIVEDHTPLTWTWDKALGYFVAVAGERGW